MGSRQVERGGGGRGGRERERARERGREREREGERGSLIKAFSFWTLGIICTRARLKPLWTVDSLSGCQFSYVHHKYAVDPAPSAEKWNCNQHQHVAWNAIPARYVVYGVLRSPFRKAIFRCLVPAATVWVTPELTALRGFIQERVS